MRNFFLASLLLVSCNGTPRVDIRKTLQEVNFEGTTIPEVKFDKDPLEITEELKSKYHSKEVLIARPAWYTSSEDYDYWLKVEFLNPEISDDDFVEFGRRVALDVIGHLSNREDFKKIEISAINKSGFIITFTSKKNTVLYLDSLQN